MKKNNERLEKIKYMKCSKCAKRKIHTKSGICVICAPLVLHGLDVKETSGNKNMKGNVIKAKVGLKDNNWMSKR